MSTTARSEASIQVKWSLQTNHRPLSRLLYLPAIFWHWISLFVRNWTRTDQRNGNRDRSQTLLLKTALHSCSLACSKKQQYFEEKRTTKISTLKRKRSLWSGNINLYIQWRKRLGRKWPGVKFAAEFLCDTLTLWHHYQGDWHKKVGQQTHQNLKKDPFNTWNDYPSWGVPRFCCHFIIAINTNRSDRV